MDLRTLNLIVNEEWFDYHFVAQFLPNGEKFRGILNKKRFKSSEDNLSSRVLNHWHEIGVLDDDRTDGKGWSKFSISEMTWISIIKTLRSFGMDMESIRKVHDYLKNYNQVKINSKYCILDFYIAYGLMFKEPVKLIVLNDGESVLCTQDALESFQQSGHLDFAYISIDINSLVSKGTHKENLTKYSKNPLESELSNSLKSEDLKELKVTIRDNAYVIKKELMMKDRTAANHLFNMIDFGTKEEVKYGDEKTFKVTESKKIKRRGKNPK